MRTVLFVSTVFFAFIAQAEECVRLKAFSNLGIPVHPGPGKPAISHRLADGTVAQRVETDPATGWIRVKANAVDGWIIEKYIAGAAECPTNAVVAPAPMADVAGLAYVIGCWNLEHFHDGATRGFPETPGKFGSRTQSEYESIAAIIEELGTKIIVLSEIHAKEVEVQEDEEIFMDVRSPELERLIEILGKENYDYVVGESGGTQRIAILYDRRSVELNATWEMDLPEIKIQKKSIADRQPLVGHFTFKHDDQRRNDVAVVGVHLASGQQKNKNHDKAMQLIQDRLLAARAEGWAIPKNENDILIMGDFNANRFDTSEEEFWDAMEGNGWDVLADDRDQYSPTRLSGNPLRLVNSRIDYIICTKGNKGLQDEEVTEAMATVHKELLAGGADEFRQRASDHLPVTVRVKVTADTDGDDITLSRGLRRYYAYSGN